MTDILQTGIAAARAAGEFLRENARAVPEVSVKDDRSLVTDLDRRAESIIRDAIQRAFPDHAILGEEGGRTGLSEYLWIVDPLDGTHNYVRKTPLYGVSVGLVRREEFVAGIIYLPESDTLFTAEAGGGAFRNDERIRVSEISEMAGCSMAFDSTFRTDTATKTGFLSDLGTRVFNIRMYGSSVVNLTRLAEGCLDIVIEFDDAPWDFAAGACILREAGGMITGFAGEQCTWRTRGYIASNGIVHEEVISCAASRVVRPGRS
ncbi:MAG: inositol monophosphatase [Chitinivibrionales bacterium]|nr:inositol monophosphatase [Chitinivibrionales bacterium]MBD3394328.1 inositol monophosphatase [Chitinivibrionales bacterium]